MRSVMFSRVPDHVDIISSVCVDVLPFAPEPLAEWSDATDLLDFLTKLYDVDSIATDEAGVERTVNYAGVGRTDFENGRRQFEKWSEEFQKTALSVAPAPGSKVREVRVPDFKLDSSFGLMAKSAIAWSAVIGSVLSEERFYSLPHTLEAEDDAICSVTLASHLYFRQAGQILRNVLEDVFIELLFCDDHESFERWEPGRTERQRCEGRMVC